MVAKLQTIRRKLRNKQKLGFSERARAVNKGLLPSKAKKMAIKKKSKSTVNKAGNYTKPTLRKRIFNRIKAGGKGGRPGQWSARKAQMMAKAYKKAGGGYRG